MNKKVARQLAATVSVMILTYGSSVFSAPSEPETYSRLNVALGGYYYTGNLNQIQGNFQGHYGLSSPTYGLDVLFNGFRLWSKAGEDANYSVVGDDAFATMLPFRYVTKRFYLASLVRYESSRNQKLDHRYLAGAGLGYAPVRSKDFLMRVSVTPSFEFAEFSGDDFRISVAHDGNQRKVFRAAILSNGWYRVAESPITLRYFAQVLPNVMDLSDLRLNITANVDLRLTETIGFRISQIINQDAAILRGKKPYDIRSTFGLVLKLK